jgi:hypothetical protein
MCVRNDISTIFSAATILSSPLEKDTPRICLPASITNALKAAPVHGKSPLQNVLFQFTFEKGIGSGITIGGERCPRTVTFLRSDSMCDMK